MSMNVDPGEIKKFQNAAADWWDKNGAFKPLHDINPLRLDYIRQRASLERSRVLDVGCGGGILSEALAGSGAHVTGIDMEADALAAACQHREKSGYSISYRQITVEELADESPGIFDVITCMELLEHVPNPFSVVRACQTLLKPGGHVIFATLNRNFKSFIFAIIGAEYVLRLLPIGTHQHSKLIRPEELRQWASDAGLQVKDVTGMGYNPFSGRYFLTRNTDVNYFMHLRKSVSWDGCEAA